MSAFRIKQHHQLLQAKKFEDMTPIALDIIGKIPEEVTQVCGPISTGGFCCKETNLKALALVIKHLQGHGYNVFNQILFENHIQRIWKASVNGYPIDLLKNFYCKIFETGMIKQLVFLPTWETSKGSRWEMRQSRRLEIPYTVLSKKEFYFALGNHIKT